MYSAVGRPKDLIRIARLSSCEKPVIGAFGGSLSTSAVPAQTLVSDFFWTVIFLVEIASIAVFVWEFSYLTCRSFINPDVINYLRHLAFIMTSTILFLLLEIMAFRLWSPP
jgi:hypothetical protein